MLRGLVRTAPKQWDTQLPQAEFAYNSMANHSMGLAPFHIVYTKAPNHLVDLATVTSPKNTKAENLADHIYQLHQQVIQHLEATYEKYKSSADKHRRFNSFEVGDLVMVYLRKECFSTGTYHKLSDKKLGPFCITQKCGDSAYRLDLPSDMHISNTFNIVDVFD